jgi:hypothetical protein
VVSGKADLTWVCSRLDTKSDKKWSRLLYILYAVFLVSFMLSWVSIESKLGSVSAKVDSIEIVVDEMNRNNVTEKELLNGIRQIFDERLGKR